jgi:hypothetical protein
MTMHMKITEYQLSRSVVRTTTVNSYTRRAGLVFSKDALKDIKGARSSLRLKNGFRIPIIITLTKLRVETCSR